MENGRRVVAVGPVHVGAGGDEIRDQYGLNGGLLAILAEGHEEQRRGAVVRPRLIGAHPRRQQQPHRLGIVIHERPPERILGGGQAPRLQSRRRLRPARHRPDGCARRCRFGGRPGRPGVRRRPAAAGARRLPEDLLNLRPAHRVLQQPVALRGHRVTAGHEQADHVRL